MFCIFVIEFIKYKMTEIVNNPVQPVKSDKTSKLILSLKIKEKTISNSIEFSNNQWFKLYVKKQ